ncbi:MAG TPA: reverse transcriptase/maturase family protein [Candidatus Methylomirabilis sp.]|nr:reverse transcriptase/maturase family protein [Candidatus Methylomirabilis sp.]
MAGTYHHGSYSPFVICDPKRREIHKASVRDRLLHHAIVRVIEPLFDRQFIYDAWSCRKGKGTHRAVQRFQHWGWSLSRNNTRTVWVLKLDIRKYFSSIDQEVLLAILGRTIRDARVMSLFYEVIGSFKPGMPLGNLTSQLFANVYLNELDQYVKHVLVVKYYLRYCDDMLILDTDRAQLEDIRSSISGFLSERLHLHIHPDKIVVRRYYAGIDVLGFVCFPYFRLLRTTSKRRLLRRYSARNAASYNGLLAYARTHGLRCQVGSSMMKLVL